MLKGIRQLISAALVLVMVMALALPASGALAASGYAATDVESSGARVRNIERAAGAISGYTLVDGEQFSFNHVVGDRSKERGYESALNGRGVKVYGGGTGQVAATLYLAVRGISGVYIDELSTYGDRYTGDYVSSGDDAVVVDWQSGTDFAFTNYTGRTLTIYAWLDDGELRVSIDESSAIAGYGTTSIYGTNAKRNNIKLAADAINGTTLGHNDVFSFNDLVGPRTSSNGYETAVNGRGVKVVGGGVAQVASSIWLAIKNMDDIEIIDKHTYGKKYSESYVESSSDAIVTDYNAGTDFSFRYTGYDEITILCYVQYDTLVCEITTEAAVG
ncbi:MAG TPA: VanW family protein [Candidatus Fimadaptatus faecigallinarum]|uniref:VanW family protein n=1 Tax=Candidatus Fimadaptatus faecigallinarum TaxID=2840814 RepID=A0A9D1LTA4_9FIRM|nr:VanW family protein [Candidatus Fimadaptatus faecigallinarum]